MNYARTRAVVRAPILNGWGLLAFAFLVGFVWLIMATAHYHQQKAQIEAKNATITAKNVPCSVRSVNDNGELQLSCNSTGKKVATSYSLAIDYLKKPRSLTCTLYRGNDADCKFAK